MLTWSEPDPPTTASRLTHADWRKLAGAQKQKGASIRFRIYRGLEPITGATVQQAQLIDEVGPLTCWNADYHGIYPKDEAELRRYVVEEGRGPVEPGTGVYAHNPGQAGHAFYAVSVAVDGEEDLGALGQGNSLAEPVTETVGPGQPVLQRIEHPAKDNYIEAPTIYYYVRWESWPRSNLPSQPFDYRVGLPPRFREPASVGLHLHCWGGNLDGGYGWWYYARQGALQVASNQNPYDWWVAYHQAYRTWQPWEEGRTRDFTVQRLLSFLEWVGTRWRIDRSRVFVAGSSMGGSGAAMLTVRYPEQFAAGISWVGVHIAAQSPQFRGSYETVCGPVEENYRHESGLPSFDYLNSALLLRQNPARDIGLLTFANGKNDGAIGWPQAVEFLRALQETRQPHIFLWGMGGHGMRACLPRPDGDSDGGPGHDDYLEFRLDRSLPAFTRCSLDSDFGTGTKLAQPQRYSTGNEQPGEDWYDGDSVGQVNRHLRWDLDEVIDQPARYELVLYLNSAAPQERCTVDVTPRRLQRFRPKPGQQFRWTNQSVADGQVVASGTVTADPLGLVTMRQITVTKSRNRVRIEQVTGR